METLTITHRFNGFSEGQLNQKTLVQLSGCLDIESTCEAFKHFVKIVYNQEIQIGIVSQGEKNVTKAQEPF